MTEHTTLLIRSSQEFLNRFGEVYEHSEWAAERAWESLNDGKPKDNLEVFNAMRHAVEEASEGKKLDLIRSHPDLAVEAAVFDDLTSSSKEEQSSAGLTHCTLEEHAEFMKLNSEYKSKFKFPFIFAVKGYDKLEILEAFRTRILNSGDDEFKNALIQIHLIALHRIEGLMR